MWLTVAPLPVVLSPQFHSYRTIWPLPGVEPPPSKLTGWPSVPWPGALMAAVGATGLGVGGGTGVCVGAGNGVDVAVGVAVGGRMTWPMATVCAAVALRLLLLVTLRVTV